MWLDVGKGATLWLDVGKGITLWLMVDGPSFWVGGPLICSLAMGRWRLSRTVLPLEELSAVVSSLGRGTSCVMERDEMGGKGDPGESSRDVEGLPKEGALSRGGRWGDCFLLLAKAG